MTPTAKDIENALRIPERWTALGSIGFPSATARRLLRLGLVERRMACTGMARTWDYRRTSPHKWTEAVNRLIAKHAAHEMNAAERCNDMDRFSRAAERYGNACAGFPPNNQAER